LLQIRGKFDVNLLQIRGKFDVNLLQIRGKIVAKKQQTSSKNHCNLVAF
jgi:hypothetical protein